MIDLMDTIQDVLEALIGTVTVDDVTYPRPYDDPAGGQSAIRYYQGSMPDKREAQDQAEDFPFCLIKPGGFTFDRHGRNEKMEIIFGMYSSGDKDDGLEMVDGLMDILSNAPRQTFSAHKLIGEFTGSMAIDNHPYYQITIIGKFRKAKV